MLNINNSLSDSQMNLSSMHNSSELIANNMEGMTKQVTTVTVFTLNHKQCEKMGRETSIELENEALAPSKKS